MTQKASPGEKVGFYYQRSAMYQDVLEAEKGCSGNPGNLGKA
jgi:hypothetical protein